VDNSARTVHGALLDAEILAEVYVAMSGGHQTVLSGMGESWGADAARDAGDEEALTPVGTVPLVSALPEGRQALLAAPSADELDAHEAILNRLGEQRIWRDPVNPAEAIEG
jgi:DNA polymerase-3 subunit epsilon